MTGPRVLPSVRAPEPTERQWMAMVVDLAETNGWLVYHTHDSRRSNPGYPDLCLARPPRLVYAELKVGRNKTTPEQEHWLQVLAHCGAETYAWWPKDWERVTQILGREVSR